MTESDRIRVVITGIGVVAPNGIGKSAFWHGLLEGKNGIGPLTRFDAATVASRVAGEVKDFHPHDRIPRHHLPNMDRAFQFGVTAAFEAIEDSGLDFDREDRFRVGVYMGVAVAGVDSGEKEFHTLRENGVRGLSPLLYQSWLPSAGSGYISLTFGLNGQSQVVSTGCTSSVDALGVALEVLRSGEEDVAIVGGAEAPLTPMVYHSFCSMRALSTRNDDSAHASRPFDRDRDGFVLAEGGAVLVMETLDHAKARGAHIYAEIAGFATTSNAHHMTAPEPTGDQASRALRLALDDAHLPSDQIGYICVHGSSTQLNEKAETAAIKKAFGPHAYKIPISSIKSMLGHPLGPAGAMQIAACAMALEEGMIPPTINYEFPDPDCDLDVVPNVARECHTRAVLSNSAGFSGKNSSTVLVAV